MIEPISLYDNLIIIAYLIAVISIGLYAKNRDKNVNDYFLAGRNLGWFAVGISLFATNISSEHFIGLSGSGATRGLAVGQFELIAIFLLVLLGWFIAPIYKKFGISTTPEYLEKRFDSSSRKFFSALSIFTYVVTKILVTLFAGGILFNKIFGWSIFSSAIVIVLVTGVYTLVGGFWGVIRTQVFQGILFFAGAILLTVFSLNEIGGFSALRAKLPEEYFQMFKAVNDPDFPWTGIIFGAPIIAFWYWCTDHYMVQRVLGARSANDARSGTLFAAFLKIFPIFILVLPGLAAVALFPEIKGDEAYPVLIASGILPLGVKGFIVAGFLAAMMSSLSAAFNSIAALFTIDFYKPKHPDASERTLVLVGRMSTIVVVVVVILLMPFVKIINSSIYIFLQSTQAFISAPIAAVFLFGFILKKVNARSAFLTLIIGEFFGLSRFVLELLIKYSLIDNQFFIGYTQINYLHFTIFLFIGSSIFLLAHSYFRESLKSNKQLLTEATGEPRLFGRNLFREESNAIHPRRNMLITVFILVVTVSIWYLFI